MIQHAPAVQASVASPSSIHVPDVVRGVMLLVGVAVLAKFTLLNEHVIFGPIAWLAFLGFVAIGVAAAVRIILIDARESALRLTRTRQVGVLKELVVAGCGSLLLIVPAAFLVMATSQEMWAGRVEDPHMSAIEFVPVAFLGLAGFFMTFWRPQFVLDRAAGKIVRYAFGRSIPLRVKELPYSGLAVYSEGYFITNTPHRLGDMIRGRVGKYTFELEMLRGQFNPEAVQRRVIGWASALGATYLTPEQAAKI
jgi:hypothetical protein